MFTWEGDANTRIRTYRLIVYSIDEEFNIGHSIEMFGTCFK